MSYRRQPGAADGLRRYKAFCRGNFGLTAQTGLPSFVTDYRDAFIYFVMHGGTWPHAPASFVLEEMDGEQRQAYLILLRKYLEARFADPSLMGLTEEQAELHGNHTEQTSSR